MLQIINDLSQSPFGIITMGLVGLVILLFFLWFGFFVVALQLIPMISAIKVRVEKLKANKEKPVITHEPASGSGLYSLDKRQVGIMPSQGKLRLKLEDLMAAAAFAEAWDHDTALDIMGRAKRKRPAVRKRVRKEKRMELRAPGADS